MPRVTSGPGSGGGTEAGYSKDIKAGAGIACSRLLFVLYVRLCLHIAVVKTVIRKYQHINSYHLRTRRPLYKGLHFACVIVLNNASLINCTHPKTSARISLSHILMTVHPAAFNIWSTSVSLSIFRRIFERQKSEYPSNSTSKDSRPRIAQL